MGNQDLYSQSGALFKGQTLRQVRNKFLNTPVHKNFVNNNTAGSDFGPMYGNTYGQKQKTIYFI